MKLLALDTSTEACSVAIYIDGEIQQRFHHQPQQQAKLLLPELHALLAEAGLSFKQIDAIAFCKGPGSFTGLRVATAAAQGLACAQDLPLVGISTLETLAFGVSMKTKKAQVAACLDARMQEVYYGVYQFDGLARSQLSMDCVIPPEKIIAPAGEACILVGNGWHVYKDKFSFDLDKFQLEEIAWPQAKDLAVLAVEDYQAGKVLAPEEALPVYIRDNVAAKKKTS